MPLNDQPPMPADYNYNNNNDDDDDDTNNNDNINDDVSLHSLTKFPSFFDWYENA